MPIPDVNTGVTDQSLPSHPTNNHSLKKREVSEPYKSDSTSRYVELVIVNDYKVVCNRKLFFKQILQPISCITVY